MNTKTLFLAAASAAALVALPVAAQSVAASAAADLNLRAGPGSHHPSLGVIMAGERVDVAGCLSTQDWCEVDSPSGPGWAYAPYLRFDEAGTLLPLGEVRTTTVTVIEDNARRDTATLAGTGIGAAAGAIITGPVGAIVGGVASGIAMHNTAGTDTTVYVQQNPVEPVYLQGEAVIGASLPPEVQLYDVPSDPLVAYMNVNGETVLVERDSRRIIHVLR